MATGWRLFFAFRSEPLNVAERQTQADALERSYDGQGWIVPRLVAATRQTTNFFFDTVTQIKLTPWQKGRVALVGDVCQCLTLTRTRSCLARSSEIGAGVAGQGASMAMAGAYLLAAESQRAGNDYQAAFTSNESRLAPEIRRRQAEAVTMARFLVPENWSTIWITNWLLKAMRLPGISSPLFRDIGANSIIQ